MPTVERQIDALGGLDPNQSEDWNEGFSDGLTAAMEIATDADATIEELVETIENLLLGTDLANWAHDSRTLINRINLRRAR